MRIVAGSARGRRLVVPEGTDVRPTSDRVREAVFNALYSLDDAVDGAVVLDLFAGTGALGLEALSRGAAKVTFVENHRDAATALSANIAALGFADRSTVIRTDARRWLSQAPHFDVAFLDPPYEFADWDSLLSTLSATLAVVESDRSIEVPGRWELVRERRYGATVVQILRSLASLE
ncbi:MAG TPA: 16S rRNA (guanine(966)-N(2))-methyltransferase RsmD [Acidimicrobiales bacterium]|nr:16S rRNA (guanine(966)-N(2))-methyltransferase RsmD [Acidimicrobiales bacterium]